ncbi:MAG: hypothetical protein ACI33M_11525 [Lysinibacillus sp.]
MDNFNAFGAANWVNIVAMIFLILCFYFTLMYFQYLKEDDDRLIKQSRLVAVICLATALLVPAFYNFYVFTKMMG